MRAFVAVSLGLVALSACGGPGPDRAHVELLFGLDAHPRHVPPARPEVVALGALLFDRGAGHAAGGCAQCHARSGLGQDGRSHERNTPALVDVTRQARFGWDGLTTDFATMVRREWVDRLPCPDDASLRAAIARDEQLGEAFAAAYRGELITIDHAVDALVAELSTWRSHGRWDRYVEGDDYALSPAERAGLATFIEVGCAACHGGRSLGGRSAHVLGLAVPFESVDRGREAVTGKAADRGVFRAPMLRLAAHTGPWLHDGSVTSLDEAVRLMGRHELGKELSEGQVAAIVTFLHAAADREQL